MNPHFWFELFQLLLVSALVLGCSVYCLLTLAPKVITRPLKQALLRGPLPALVKTRLQQTSAGGACGSNCGGCTSNTAHALNPRQAAIPQAVKWHPRQR